MNELQILSSTPHWRVKNLSGQKFGFLTVTREAGKDKHRNRVWECLCVCGNSHFATRGQLINGGVKSCGCKKGDMIAEKKTTHGACGTFAYSCWNNMKARAASNKTLEARRYAKRDIPICDEWSDYLTFIQDMGYPPSEYHSIERRDNDLGYDKENCYWATEVQQQRNKSSNRIVEYLGKKMCVAEFAERIGMKRSRVAHHVRAGKTVEEIIQKFVK